MDLRDEIIESQKARADLFKWKIILVAAIGAAALGLGETGPKFVVVASSGRLVPAGESTGAHQYLLCLVPLVCVYTDVLCAHINLRIRVIGQFLRLYGNLPPPADLPPQALQEEKLNLEYEEFAHEARKMENTPRTHLNFHAPWRKTAGQRVQPPWGWTAFIVAGSSGIAASLWALYEYNNRLRCLKHLAFSW